MKPMSSELVGRLILAGIGLLVAWWLVGAFVTLVEVLLVPAISIAVIVLMLWGIFLRENVEQDLNKTLAPRPHRQNVTHTPAGPRPPMAPGNRPVRHSGNFKSRP